MRGPSMGEVSTIGLDIAKSVFQVHGVDADGAVVIRKRISRAKVLEIRVTKSDQQQSGLMLHRGRQLLVRQRTMLSNAIRGHMAELGIISAKGRNGTAELLEIIANADDDRIPAVARLTSTLLLGNTTIPRQRSEPLRSISMAGTDHVKKVGGSRKSLAWARSSPPRWLPRWVIGKHFRPDATWRPGSGLFPSSIRRVAKIDLAGSQSKAIDICDGCSSLGRWRSFGTRGSTVRSGFGSRVSWNVGR